MTLLPDHWYIMHPARAKIYGHFKTAKDAGFHARRKLQLEQYSYSIRDGFYLRSPDYQQGYNLVEVVAV